MGLEIHTESFGVTGSKSHFHRKCYFSYSLHGMIMIFINLTLSTKIKGLKIYPGSFGVTGVNGNFQLKMV